MAFVRYNSTLKFWEYDSSGGNGAGPWLILPVDLGKGEGSVPPDSLPANVAYKNVDNYFSTIQTIQCNNPQLIFQNQAGPVNNRRWTMLGYDQNIYFQTQNDDGSVQGNPLWFTRSGQIFERHRQVAMGEWQDYTPTWANGGLIGNGGIYGKYMLIGKTLFFKVNLITGTTTVYPSGAWGFSVPSPYPVGPFGPNYQFGSMSLYMYNGETYNGTSFNGTFFGMANYIVLFCNCGTKHPFVPLLQPNVPIAWGANTSYLYFEGHYEF